MLINQLSGWQTELPYAFVSKVSKKNTYTKNILNNFLCFFKFMFNNTKKWLYKHNVGKKVVPLHRFTEKSLKMQKQVIAELISSVWQDLTVEQLQLITDSINVKEIKKNSMIYDAGDIPEQMAFVIEGKVKIYKNTPGNRCQILRIAQTGDFFGYRAYLVGEPHSSSASAFENCKMAFIPLSVLDRLMKENHNVTMYIIKVLARQLGKSDQRTIDLTQKHLRGRLAESLLLLKERYGVGEDGCTINISLTREDLANMSNMTTSNAIRTLSNFSATKLIATDGRKIKVLREDELRKISKLG